MEDSMKKNLSKSSRMLSLMLICSLLTSNALISYSDPAPKSLYPAKRSDAVLQKNTDKKPVNVIKVDGHSLVSISDFGKAINATYDWNSKTKTITLKKDFLTLKITVGEYEVQSANGDYVDYLPIPAGIYSGKVMVPLRSLAEKMGSIVSIDPKTNKVYVQPTDSVLISDLDSTHIDTTERWAQVSTVQQFLYKEQLAYAFVHQGKLIIKMPNGQLDIKMKYPLLGDVIADPEGHLYVVWGKEGKSPQEETIFISKFSPKGDELKTTGFRGVSVLGTDGNTKTPFYAGNCISALGNGRLMVNYARKMYNAHQSNNVIGVNISDMSPVTFNDIYKIPYTSHSFNQSVIWSNSHEQFIYADHGDAYDRGFIITTHYGEKNIFHFYLEPKSNYDMFIVNETFAQLGNISEVENKLAFVGSSARSISESAKKEKQDLFLQIFDPTKSIDPSIFVGGVSRTGTTSTDIHDKDNSAMGRVSDHGIHWLTDYTSENAIAPQVITYNNMIIILWSTETDSFYMILSKEGNIIKPATSLKKTPLNSYERPILINNAIHWVALKDGKLQRYHIQL